MFCKETIDAFSLSENFFCALLSSVVLAIILEMAGRSAKLAVNAINLVLGIGVIQDLIIECRVERQFVLVSHVFNVLAEILDVGFYNRST